MDSTSQSDRKDFRARLLYLAMKYFARPLTTLIFGLRIDWRSPSPDPGKPAIFAANHSSFVDPIALGLAMRLSDLTFMAKAAFFDGSMAWFFRGLGQIPVDPAGGHAAHLAMDTVKEDILGTGKWLGIFPEGGLPRCGTSHIHKGKTGVARLALQSDARLYAVGIVGASRVLAVDTKRPHLARVRFAIEEIDLAPYRAMPQNGKTYRALTLHLMQTIAKLTDQVYEDVELCKA